MRFQRTRSPEGTLNPGRGSSLDRVCDEAPPGGLARSKARLYRSAMMAVTLQWSLRLIGLLSVYVLARLLSPDDFGVIGLAMATIALVEVFSFIGLRQALLRIAQPVRAHLDTAWTIQLLLFGTLGAVLVAVAPLAARLYDEPALEAVITVLATRFLFLGLVNIGIVDFDRHLQFGRDLRMRLGARLTGFAATLTAAVLLHSYWALVIGLVLQSAFLTAASYAAHPYRPRLSLARRGELLNVSGWMFLNSAAQMFHDQVERLLIGRVGTMHQLGLYSVSKDLSAIFTQEVATALNRVTFVTTATARRHLSEQADRIAAILGAYALIAAPLGLGLAAVAEDAVAVLLGNQWTGAAPLLRLIAPASAIYAVYRVIASSLQASGLARQAALLSCGGAAAAAVTVGTAAMLSGSATVIAGAALGATAALLLSSLAVLARIARTGSFRLVAQVARPFAAAGVMLLLVSTVGAVSGAAILDLVLKMTLGAVTYLGALFLLWLAAGRPPGAEGELAVLFGRVRGRCRRAEVPANRQA